MAAPARAFGSGTHLNIYRWEFPWVAGRHTPVMRALVKDRRFGSERAHQRQFRQGPRQSARSSSCHRPRSRRNSATVECHRPLLVPSVPVGPQRVRVLIQQSSQRRRRDPFLRGCLRLAPPRAPPGSQCGSGPSFLRVRQLSVHRRVRGRFQFDEWESTREAWMQHQRAAVNPWWRVAVRLVDPARVVTYW